MTLWINRDFKNTAIVYTGAVMSLSMSFVAAAWVIVQSTEAVAAYTAPFFEGYYFTYAGASTLANNIGLYELISFILWAFFSLAISIATMWLNSKAWSMMEAREAGVLVGGTGGIVLDPVTGAKIFTLQILAGLMSIIGGFALGDTADNLLTWWDSYSTKDRNEGQDKDTGKFDPDGTAAEYDFLYHYVTMIFGYLTFGTIAAGGFIFAFTYMKAGPAVNCDLNAMNSSQINGMISAFGKVAQSKQACYENMPSMLQIMDLNKNGFIDRCEDALFQIHVVGNPEEYAVNYGNVLPLSAYKYRCDQIFNPLW